MPIDINGEVNLTVGRASGSRTLTYSNFEYGFIGNLLDDDGLDTVVTLNQQVTDTVVEQPRHFFTTNFTVTAPFTNGEELTITTTERFENIVVADELGTPNYINGQLIAETADGERLTWSADPANLDTWTARVAEGDRSLVLLGFWSESARLPCISASREDESLIGCQFQ